MASPLAERLRRHVRRARLFPKAGTAIVAVSGGADSVALLDLLHHLAPELGLTLVVAHADHGIQPGSGDVGKWVRGLAEQYGLSFALHLARRRAAAAGRALPRHRAPPRRPGRDDPAARAAWQRARWPRGDCRARPRRAGAPAAAVLTRRARRARRGAWSRASRRSRQPRSATSALLGAPRPAPAAPRAARSPRRGRRAAPRVARGRGPPRLGRRAGTVAGACTSRRASRLQCCSRAAASL